MGRILVLSFLQEDALTRFEQAAGTQFCVQYLPPDTPEEKLLEAISAAEVVIGQPPVQLLCQAPQLRLVQMTWAGTDRYTCGCDFPRGITLCNASGAYGVTIAEHLMAGLLALCRMLPKYIRAQAAGQWKDLGSEITLEGKTVLVLGTGDIGTAFAKRLQVFDTYVIGVRRTQQPLPPFFAEQGTMAQLDALLARADVVACCLPNTAQTAGLFGYERLRRMKKGALLLNVGRGTLVDADALAEVLREGHLAGAALDVTAPEPLPMEHPLWKMENVVLTPHVAGLAEGHLPQTTERIVKICEENLRCYAAQKPLHHVVDLNAGY